jgi:intermediate peptidase
MLDQEFHLTDFDNTSLRPIDLIEECTTKYYSLPFVANTHWHLRFTHLVGYGAKYYSYLVSKAIASNIWTECFEKDPLNSTAGANYRDKLLQFGGERRPQELISSLVGFDVENKSLVKSLTRHI